MGTDESTTESERFARVRTRLSTPSSGGVDTSSVRERLPSLDTEGRHSVQLCDRGVTVAGTTVGRTGGVWAPAIAAFREVGEAA